MLTTRFVTGSLVWADFSTPDIEGANAFYGTLFGWDAESSGEEFGGYVMYRSDGKDVAGGMAVPPEQGPAAWSLYFRTPDADAAAKAAEQAGGAVVFEPMDVGDLGRMAVLKDAEGASFGVWQPGVMQGFGAVQVPGSLCWAELYAADVPAAAAFYSAVLGLQSFDVPFPGGSYTTLHPAGTEADAMFGGILPAAAAPAGADGGAHWLPYFEVTDCDSAARRAGELGGAVRKAPTDLEGVGRTAHLADPYGARFAVLKSVPQEGSGAGAKP
ncbi:VOC family protein [Streptomyces monticola]|uniref:VOC family protein n=1 Tax=Streptomyces monticola TaxID=2666263 RepID=A0ABW2JBZ3_9ACTN